MTIWHIAANGSSWMGILSLKELEANMQITTDGIIIGRRNYGDDDRLVTILTKDWGVLSAYVKGASRLRSKHASSTELLCYAHFVLFKNKDRYFVDHADPERLFFGIRQDIVKLSLASYLAELTWELAPKLEAAGQYLKLLLNCLHLLEKGELPPGQIKALYELRILTMSGYMPNLVGCRNCGVFEGPDMRFSPYSGELLCENCYTAWDDSVQKERFRPVGKGVLSAMRHVLYAEGNRLYRFSLSGESVRSFEAVCEEYLLCQVEKTFQSLTFYGGLSVSGEKRGQPVAL